MMPITTTANKHSFYTPNVPASAPTTPAYTRSAKSNTDGPPPVTPQRIPRAHRHQHHLQNYFSNSPSTPASTLSTPYTPLSLRNVWSNDSSALTTPVSVASSKRTGMSVSPESSVNGFGGDAGQGETANDWRSRAGENGIRVASVNGSKDEDVLLSPPFFSTQRRPRSQTLAHQSQPPLSPQIQSQPHTPGRRTLAALNTPPPLASNVNRLKAKGSLTDPAYPRRRQPFGQTRTDLFDIDENDPYPMMFSPVQRLAIPLALNDPFGRNELDDMSFPRIPAPAIYPFDERPNDSSKTDDSCSVCGQTSSSLAVLDPCSHVLCSACLTSALNIVGEKDMECAVCKIGVAAFHLRSSGAKGASPPNTAHGASQHSNFGTNDADGPFGHFNFFNVPETASSHGFGGARHMPARPGELPVLRIDNVPWDITPPAIVAWLRHPVRRVHVLLDRKGKTFSHAFVEMVDEEAARQALRTAQNSVLGKGKRARGVTVTRSGQEELMKALFPSWQGCFDGVHPSLAGLSNEQIYAALENGLISDSELKALLHLIQSPDSHFLKVPSLPFHSLISILSKFPANQDGRIYSGSSRDILFEITITALQILILRNTDESTACDPGLLVQLFQAAGACQAFSREQIANIANIANTSHHLLLPRSPASSISALSSHTPDHLSQRHTNLSRASIQAQPIQALQRGPFDVLAREFGVDSHLVEALAHRLSGLR